MNKPLPEPDAKRPDSDTPRTDAAIIDGGASGNLSWIPPSFCRQLERELNEWTVLQLWGKTPEHIHDFIKRQQARIHATQDIERELNEARQRSALRLQVNIELVEEAEQLRAKVDEQEQQLKDASMRGMKVALDAYTADVADYKATIAALEADRARLVDKYSACAVSIAGFDVQYHSLRSAAHSVLNSQRPATRHQALVLTERLDKLADEISKDDPKWPAIDAAMQPEDGTTKQPLTEYQKEVIAGYEAQYRAKEDTK